MDLKELVIKRERKMVKQATMINHNKAIVKIEHRMKTIKLTKQGERYEKGTWGR